MNILTPTADGSNTFFSEQIGEHYHSKHGALQESQHVFINAGLLEAKTGKTELSIFEVGFGTGLNFLLSLDYCIQSELRLNYTSVEAYPLSHAELSATGYQNFVHAAAWETLQNGYTIALQGEAPLPGGGSFNIPVTSFQDFQTTDQFDLLYYDAFSVRHQPELWTDECIAHAASLLKPGGIFVTYAITGKLKRALKAAGCEIEKLPGAPGKREMLRARRF
ncbi:tRNA (5-methylaminomethyl-2-thiouridine)(34)-methyltransferase MnmD [Pedobacter sp. SYP-B3415]|uniref:tRNA (5-methylaminomethyl-2-thiouridine)(34)-methyltransferase MnmD n=1 Tax=Pedobacter sp. SYP-B3415 TaxID=2496641 RepID=UPI00101DBECD|nr:tRNA (5-methylaminomethyl-2-thiouridine)(34)-methyltransferase MnmD [Pedobacter sp. SYP-B3415]